METGLDFWENGNPKPLPTHHSKLPTQLCSGTQQAKIYQGFAGIERWISRIPWQKFIELSSKKREAFSSVCIQDMGLRYGNMGMLPFFPSHLFPPNSRPPENICYSPTITKTWCCPCDCGLTGGGHGSLGRKNPQYFKVKVVKCITHNPCIVGRHIPGVFPQLFTPGIV